MAEHFHSYADAYRYWQRHKDEAPEGLVLAISSDGFSVRLREIDEEVATKVKRPKPGVYSGFGSDTLGDGVSGMLNHADGKRYDSKSQYLRAVRDKGCRVVGNDWNKAEWKPPIERGIKGDFNVKPALKQALEKVMGC